MKTETMEQRLLREYFGVGTEARDDAERRLREHEPLAYILGDTVFYRETYRVTPDVLIPRPDTERLVEKIIEKLPADGNLLDLCTGSGCVAISAIRNGKPGCRAVAADLSEAALEIARENAARNCVSDRIEFLRENVLHPAIDPSLRFDVIASNPPYVKSAVVDTLEPECQREPRIAFDGGEDGMNFYRAILCGYASLLKPGGCFLFEIGYDQREDISALAAVLGYSCTVTKDYGGNDRVAHLIKEESKTMTFHNPIDPGCYADPEARFYEGKYYIYATRSLPFGEQKNQDGFVSEDLKHFEKIENLIAAEDFPWVTHAVWAPTIIEKNGKYYYIFASNNIQKDGEIGGIEIAVADTPRGPFRGYLPGPLVGNFVNGAQPIDAHLFKDDDGSIYLLFGGWGHCNIAKMNEEMNGFIPFPEGGIFREITPPDYVEGPCMLKRKGVYYFMWSAGCWTDGSYRVNFCKADTPWGPFGSAKTVLSSLPPVGEGPGHHGFLELPDDKWLIVYHRHNCGDSNGNHRYLCIDEMRFDENGDILPVILT